MSEWVYARPDGRHYGALACVCVCVCVCVNIEAIEPLSVFVLPHPYPRHHLDIFLGEWLAL